MAPKMTHVYAAAAGIVAVIDHGSAGRYVEIQHKPDGRPAISTSTTTIRGRTTAGPIGL